MFYVAHRLFAAHDRQLGALVASRLADAVGVERVFLPFCDTDEEDLQAEVKGRRLFDLDRERLPQLHGLLAVLHGPSLDDGVCMEVGYAAAMGIPVVALTTDFITYGLREAGPGLAFPDPLIEAVVAEVVRVERLGRPARSSGDRFAAFGVRNARQIELAVEHAVARLLYHACAPPAALPAAAEDIVFVEPSPYRTGNEWDAAVGLLDKGHWRVRKASRLQVRGDPIDFARADWKALAGCRVLVADVGGPETPPGAALMIGACLARGQRIIACQAVRSWTFAVGREPNWRNLMIQYAVNGRIDGPEALAAELNP